MIVRVLRQWRFSTSICRTRVPLRVGILWVRSPRNQHTLVMKEKLFAELLFLFHLCKLYLGVYLHELRYIRIWVLLKLFDGLCCKILLIYVIVWVC